jgi:hypothetical protein
MQVRVAEWGALRNYCRCRATPAAAAKHSRRIFLCGADEEWVDGVGHPPRYSTHLLLYPAENMF